MNIECATLKSYLFRQKFQMNFDTHTLERLFGQLISQNSQIESWGVSLIHLLSFSILLGLAPSMLISEMLLIRL